MLVARQGRRLKAGRACLPQRCQRRVALERLRARRGARVADLIGLTHSGAVSAARLAAALFAFTIFWLLDSYSFFLKFTDIRFDNWYLVFWPSG